MFSLTKKLFKFLVALFVFEKSLAFDFNYNSINITEMSIYLQHFNNEILFKIAEQLTVVQSVENKRAEYFLNELLDEYSKNLNYKLTIKNVNRSYKNSFDYVNMMLIDSYESFEKINAGPVTTTHDFSEYHIIIYYSVSESPENEIQKIFNYCWQFYTVNVALLLKTQDEAPIKLYTYYPFTQESCKKAQVHVINQNKSILQMKISDIYPDKLNNFHNCTLMAALWNVPPYLTLPEPESGTNEMSGFEGYLLNVLSQILEFNIDYVVPLNNEQRGLVKEDGTLTGALKMLKDRSADLSLGSFRRELQRSTVCSPSTTTYHTMQIFTVLDLRQPWSSLEIIAFPFQLHIWVVLMLLTIFLLSSPWILKFYFKNALKFIYGFSSIYFINTNIMAITLNQNANFVPKRNFARFILLMWIWLTMIIRSIYQGALYNFLTTQKRRAPVDSIDGLINRQYKLVVNLPTSDTISKIPVVRDKLLEVLAMNISDDGGFPLLEANPDKNYVTGSPKDFFIYYTITHNKKGVFHVLKEIIFTQQLCIYFTKHSYLLNTFDRVLERLKYFGLIDYWANLLVGDRYLQRTNDEPTPTSLTLAQLSGIFQICLVLYFLTFIVFLCEVFWFNLKKKKSHV